MVTGVSVIICCYNSASRIRETLRHLFLQKTESSLLWEIIIIDNASTDNIAQVASAYWENLNTTVKLSVVKEPVPGLSRARFTGVKSAVYDVIIFCDDDNRLFESYIQIAFDVMQSNKKIGALGGEGIAVSDKGLPDWFEEYKRYYACYPQAEKTGVLTSSSAFLYGAGLVIRKKAIEYLYSLKINFLTTDRSGDKLASGGDNELCYLLRLTGYELWYDERLKFYHYMPEQRLAREYLFRLSAAISYSSMKLILYHYALTKKKVTMVTWHSDFILRLYYLVIGILKTPTASDSMEKKVKLVGSWNALLAIVHQFGQYQKIFKTIINVKRI